MFTLFFQYLVYIAAIGSLFAAFVYIRSMLKGGAKPNRITWLMWSIAPLIGTAAELSNGVRLAALPVFMSGFGPLLVFIASFAIEGAHWKLTRFDYAYGTLSALALVLWALTKDPNFAIVFAIASDALAAIPTIRKAWSNPKTESIAPFAMSTIGNIAALGVASIWAFSYYAFPIYLICINLLIILIVRRKVARAANKQKTRK